MDPLVICNVHERVHGYDHTDTDIHLYDVHRKLLYWMPMSVFRSHMTLPKHRRGLSKTRNAAVVDTKIPNLESIWIGLDDILLTWMNNLGDTAYPTVSLTHVANQCSLRTPGLVYNVFTAQPMEEKVVTEVFRQKSIQRKERNEQTMAQYGTIGHTNGTGENKSVPLSFPSSSSTEDIHPTNSL